MIVQIELRLNLCNGENKEAAPVLSEDEEGPRNRTTRREMAIW
jgi:hypothetical protein